MLAAEKHEAMAPRKRIPSSSSSDRKTGKDSLRPPTHKPAHRRPSRPSSRSLPAALRPITAKPDFDRLEISTHTAFAAKRGEIFRRFDAHPDLSVLFLINPVLALKEVGVELDREVSHHLLRGIQHPPKARQRRDELERELEERLGESPRPTDAVWLAATLFGKLQVQPRVIRGRQPVYADPLDPEAVERLQALRPARRKRRGGKPPAGTRVSVRAAVPTVRRLDLDAELPELKPAARAPKRLTVEGLYFYKDAHPVARQLLELAIFQNRAFPIHTAATYRAIKKGEKPNAFRGWIRSIRFRQE